MVPASRGRSRGGAQQVVMIASARVSGSGDGAGRDLRPASRPTGLFPEPGVVSAPCSGAQSTQRSYPAPTFTQAFLPPLSSSSSSASFTSLPAPPSAQRDLEAQHSESAAAWGRGAWEGRAECTGFLEERVPGTEARLPGSRGLTSALARHMRPGRHRARSPRSPREQIPGPQPLTGPGLLMQCSHGP